MPWTTRCAQWSRERLALRLRLLPQDGGAQHDVAFERILVIVHEREHVGRVVLAAVERVQRLALALADEAQRSRAQSRSSAAFAQRRSAAARGQRRGRRAYWTASESRGARLLISDRLAGLLRGDVALVGADDLLHQRMADDVGAREAA